MDGKGGERERERDIGRVTLHRKTTGIIARLLVYLAFELSSKVREKSAINDKLVVSRFVNELCMFQRRHCLPTVFFFFLQPFNPVNLERVAKSPIHIIFIKWHYALLWRFTLRLKFFNNNSFG